MNTTGAAIALALAMTLVACTSSKSTDATAGPTTAVNATSGSSSTVPDSSSTTPGAPDPNAPEVVAPGDIPDNQVFVPFSPSSGGYRAKVPEGWSRTEVGGVTVFSDQYNAIRLETTPASTAPTVDTVRSGEIPPLASGSKGFQLGDLKVVQRPAGDVVLVTYQANSEPNRVTGKVARLDVERYEFWHNGTELVITLSGAVGADNVDPWKTVTNSVVWS